MYILGEVNPDTPEATLAGIVGISWIDDGQAPSILKAITFTCCIFTGTF